MKKICICLLIMFLIICSSTWNIVARNVEGTIDGSSGRSSSSSSSSSSSNSSSTTSKSCEEQCKYATGRDKDYCLQQCSGGSGSSSGCKEGYKKEDGVCKIQCDTGYIANSSNSDCLLVPVNKISAVTNTKYLALGESMPQITFIAFNTDYSDVTQVKWTVSDARFKLSNTSGNSTTLSFTGTSAGTYNYIVTGGNSAGSASASGSVVVYNCAWSSQSGKWYYKTAQPAKGLATIQSGCGFFEGLSLVDGGVSYSKYWSRCCSLASMPAQDYGACYGDEPYYGIAKNMKWMADDKPSGVYKYRYDTSTISEESKCVSMPQGNKCTAGDVGPKAKEIYTNACEDTVSFTVDSMTRKCANDGNSFYSINCNRSVDIDFDYGDDDIKNTNNELIRGIGFEFGIDVKTKVTCKATFYPDIWLNEYNKVMNQLKTVVPYNNSFKTTGYQGYQNSKKSNNPKSAFEAYINELKKYEGSKFTNNTVSYLYELYTLASDLEDIVTGYNNYSFKEEYDEQAYLDMSYNTKDNSSKNSYNYTFDKKEVCSPNTKKNESIKYNQVKDAAPWLEVPSNYERTYTRTISLYPKQTYIDKVSANVKDDSNDALDGGNKIYIDYYALEGQTISPINIRVEGLAGNNSIVINNKCSINIKKSDILYRPIDITNPFINSEWKTGDNWLNNQFDFRNIIDKNIWSK